MAQLSDDCFAFGGALLAVDQAEALIAERIPALAGAEAIALHALRGRVLAADLLAGMALPPFHNAAVDGYAFRHADLSSAGETTLRLAGRVAAGHDAGLLPPGAAMRIFTGAPMPSGADCVLMQEDAREADGLVMVPPGLQLGLPARTWRQAHGRLPRAPDCVRRRSGWPLLWATPAC